MYQNLLYAVKRRILDETEQAFQSHPAFNEKVKIYHKFPYQERVQYGVVLKNTSSSTVRMSADNYLSDLISHVRLAREGNYPGLSIEWVRENARDVTAYEQEDVSAQLGPTQRMFHTAYPILSGPGNTKYATNIGQVEVYVDGLKELPDFIDGERGVVILRRAPAAGLTVTISYYRRKIVDPGIYVFDFIEDNQFLIAPIYVIKRELVVETTTGSEVTVNLAHQNVDPNSDWLILQYRNSNVPRRLVRGTDYSISYLTGEITFLLPLPVGYQLFADYRWQPTNYANGPYTFNTYTENHTILPGVVLAIGRRAKKGDRQVIIVSQQRESQARIYGGHWTMSLDLSVIAKDPIQMEEMADHLVSYLWGIRKNVLESEGITLLSVEPTGESEESFMDLTGDLYYTTSVSISLQSEWQEFVPYLYEIRDIVPDIYLWPGTHDYTVSDNYTISLTSLTPDLRPVMVYPTTGYERLT